MKEKGIGKTVVCTGKGGISVDISQIEKNHNQNIDSGFAVPKGT